jgi:hypothetical protein
MFFDISISYIFVTRFVSVRITVIVYFNGLSNAVLNETFALVSVMDVGIKLTSVGEPAIENVFLGLYNVLSEYIDPTK